MTSKPQGTPRCPLGFNRTGLVAVLCKCVVLSLPATVKSHSRSFPLLLPPLSPFILDLQLSSHRSVPQCGSLTVPCSLASVRIQEAGESSEASAEYAYSEVCAIT